MHPIPLFALQVRVHAHVRRRRVVVQLPYVCYRLHVRARGHIVSVVQAAGGRAHKQRSPPPLCRSGGFPYQQASRRCGARRSRGRQGAPLCSAFSFARLARPLLGHVGWQGLLASGASVNESDPMGFVANCCSGCSSSPCCAAARVDGSRAALDLCAASQADDAACCLPGRERGAGGAADLARCGRARKGASVRVPVRPSPVSTLVPSAGRPSP